MLAHLHQPEIDRLATHGLRAAYSPHVFRHLEECDLCLRRLLDAELRLMSVESANQTQDPAQES